MKKVDNGWIYLILIPSIPLLVILYILLFLFDRKEEKIRQCIVKQLSGEGWTRCDGCKYHEACGYIQAEMDEGLPTWLNPFIVGPDVFKHQVES